MFGSKARLIRELETELEDVVDRYADLVDVHMELIDSEQSMLDVYRSANARFDVINYLSQPGEISFTVVATDGETALVARDILTARDQEIMLEAADQMMEEVENAA